MADPTRARKVAERIKVLMAQGIETLVKDPRLGFITITDARVTGDLQQATVFYTVLGTDQERADAAEVLEDYRGRLRSHMGKGLGIRLTPTLEFVPDALPEDAAHMEDIFRKVHERDAELAANRGAGGYAGEEDPYRKPRVAQPSDSPREDAGESDLGCDDAGREHAGRDDAGGDDAGGDDAAGDDAGGHGTGEQYADGRD